MPRYAAVLFDIDGTLVDSNAMHVDVWDAVFRDAGHAFDRRTIHHQIGKGGDNLVPALLPDSSNTEREQLETAHGELFKARYLDLVRPFPGARDLLAAVHRAGTKVVLASSAGANELDHYLDLLGARDLVDATTSKDDVGRSKPAPDIFALALERAGTPTSDTRAVGDTPYDVAAAGQCGIATLAVLSGGFSEADLRGAEAIYRDVAEMLARGALT